MFYRPADGHGLPHNPFNALITPRPIGWISTRSAAGEDNLAPYSFFNGAAYVPPQVMFTSTDVKDNLTNIQQTGVFCVNICAAEKMDAMNITSAALPHDVDEFVEAGVDKVECSEIACARVGDAPASMECRMTEIVRLKGADNYLILGEVVGIHMRDDYIVDGKFDATLYQPLSRMGYRDYTIVKEVFELKRPDD